MLRQRHMHHRRRWTLLVWAAMGWSKDGLPAAAVCADFCGHRARAWRKARSGRLTNCTVANGRQREYEAAPGT